jgi:hypothetical protein
MLAMRLPRPMSAAVRRARLPVKRSSLSQIGLSSGRRPAACQAFGAQRLGQQLLAQRARLVLRQRLEVVADLGARAPGAHEAQPGRVGLDTGAVTSTTSPFLSSVRSGTCSPLILAATVWSPTLLWMA